MSRITVTNLRNEIDSINNLLLINGSPYSYKYQHRNGYHAVDLMKKDDMYTRCVRLLDCAEPPRVLIEKLLNDYKYYLNENNS